MINFNDNPCDTCMDKEECRLKVQMKYLRNYFEGIDKGYLDHIDIPSVFNVNLQIICNYSNENR